MLKFLLIFFYIIFVTSEDSNIISIPFNKEVFESIIDPNLFSEKMKVRAAKVAKILKYLIEECKRKSGGDFTYKFWKNEEEKFIHSLTNSTLNSIKTKEEAKFLGRRYQKTAEKFAVGDYGEYYKDIPNLFPNTTVADIPSKNNSIKICNYDDYDSLPRIGRFSILQNQFIFTCFLSECLNSKNVKCEESIPTEKCVGHNQWISGFTKFDNLTRDLVEVKCCTYIGHTHTRTVSQEIVNELNYETDWCQFNELSSPSTFSFINNITKMENKFVTQKTTLTKTKFNFRQHSYTVLSMSCPQQDEFETTIHFDSYKAHKLDDELRGNSFKFSSYFNQYIPEIIHTPSV